MDKLDDARPSLTEERLRAELDHIDREGWYGGVLNGDDAARLIRVALVAKMVVRDYREDGEMESIIDALAQELGDE